MVCIKFFPNVYFISQEKKMKNSKLTVIMVFKDTQEILLKFRKKEILS